MKSLSAMNTPINLGDPAIAKPCDGVENGKVFELYAFDPDAQYVIPVGSIGRHAATGGIRAAADMRFQNYPGYQCLYPPPPEDGSEKATQAKDS